jgi:hypothetical protein
MAEAANRTNLYIHDMLITMSTIHTNTRTFDAVNLRTSDTYSTAIIGLGGKAIACFFYNVLLLCYHQTNNILKV